MENIAVFSVYEITRHLRQVIESSIEPLYVAGEISGFVHHNSGHMYFNLKDENATLRCTFFRNVNYRLDFKPKDGMQVVCYGKMTVFEKGGTYNLNVQNMTQAGLGAMQIKFEALKKKLQIEGLFDPKHKKPLPKYPERIGIVTSPTGAALQDIRNIILRRYPVEIVVYPALVQGEDAPPQIAAGVKYFNDNNMVDLIIVTRGGGSQEDLFCFNDEALARTIFASRIPVVSAVGHEIDFTLADFVADLRAPTPSAAAELAVPDKKDLIGLLDSYKRRLDLTAGRDLANFKEPLLNLQMQLGKYHPEKLWQSYQQRFDIAGMGLINSFGLVENMKMQFENKALNLTSILSRKSDLKLSSAKVKLELAKNRLVEGSSNRLTSLQAILKSNEAILAQLSPRKIQSKGWIMVFKGGKVLKSVTQLKANDQVQLDFIDGKADGLITKTEERL
jgi:exodeoxyribonuclease VII large subunit